tara:strand:+ start:443 stop:1345 length:903 start_codon:yes stop_codon:yes gene_type:complete
MHASGKIFMGIGLVLVLIGGGMFAWGSMTVDDAVDDLEDNYWELEGVTSGTIEIVDDDGEGEFGFSIFIEGTYTDDDGDGDWDHCDSYDQSSSQTDFTTTHTDDSSNSFIYACDTDWNYEDAREEGGKTLVRIGDSAFGYENGTATVSCATTCWVQYDDKVFVDALGDVGEAAGGILSMLGSTCFFIGGCCLLLLGLILGLTINDKPQTVVVQGGGGGMVGMGAPVVGAPGGAVPMMGAPVAVAPMAAPVAAQPMAVPVAAAPVAQPDPAREYYNGLLTQGYDAASATQYTAQHYPGFQG